MGSYRRAAAGSSGGCPAGAFTLHPLLIAVPWAACFVLGLLDWHHPWRVGHLDLLALAGFFPVAMLLSDDASAAGLRLAAACLGWLFARMLGAAFGIWPMPDLRPSISSRWLGLAILALLLVRIGSLAGRFHFLNNNLRVRNGLFCVSPTAIAPAAPEPLPATAYLARSSTHSYGSDIAGPFSQTSF